jgi:hypothetical protein
MRSQPGGLVEIEPLLDPGYWGDHEFGKSLAEAPHHRQASEAMTRIVLGSVRQAADSRRSRNTLETYQTGSVFDFRDYDEGALFVLGQELLLPIDCQEQADMSEFRRESQPTPPTSKDLKANQLPIGQSPERLIGHCYIYERAFYIGSVVANTRQELRLVTMPAAVFAESVSRGLNPKVVAPPKEPKRGQPPKPRKPLNLNKALKSPKICLQSFGGARVLNRTIAVGPTRHLESRRSEKGEKRTEESIVRTNYVRVLGRKK